MLYQQKLLADMSDVGEPGPLPQPLVGRLSQADLEDLSWTPEELGLRGYGFFVVAGPGPEPDIRRVPRVRFIQRIPIAKRAGIVVSDNPLVKAFLFTLQATETVELDNDDTVAGVAYLVSQSLLTDDEAEALLA